MFLSQVAFHHRDRLARQLRILRNTIGKWEKYSQIKIIQVARADLDGKNALVIVSNDLSELDQIALDLSNQRVYFSESKAGRVCICNKLTNFFFTIFTYLSQYFI